MAELELSKTAHGIQYDSGSQSMQMNNNANSVTNLKNWSNPRHASLETTQENRKRISNSFSFSARTRAEVCGRSFLDIIATYANETDPAQASDEQKAANDCNDRKYFLRRNLLV